MEEIKVTYSGNIKTTAAKGGSQITTATDNSPESRTAGTTFTPVDMLVNSLGACMLSMMGATAARKGLDIARPTATLTYDTDPATHRVTAVRVVFDVDGTNLSEADRKVIMGAAKACPVAASLSESIAKELVFNF